jgi:hypothetical protein
MLLALGGRVATRAAPQHGHRQRPRPSGRASARSPKLVASPFVPIVGTIRIVVAIFSYDGALYFGVTGDRDHAPDVDVLTSGIEADVERLLTAVG